MFLIKKYKHSQHAEDLALMLISQSGKIPPKSEMPKNGYILYSEGKPIAACFLRLVEGGFGQIDGLVADRYAPRELKQQAIDIAIEKCIDKARSLRIKNLLAFCQSERPTMTALSHGFVKLPHNCLALDTQKG